MLVLTLNFSYDWSWITAGLHKNKLSQVEDKFTQDQDVKQQFSE